MKRLFPNLGAFLWLAFFLALVFSEWRLVLISADGDPGWHWAQGNWTLEHHTVMRADEFSHTRPGAPVVGKEWLSQVIFALAGNALGWNGLILLAAAIIATTLWLLHRQLLAEGNELLLSTGFVLVAAFTATHHWLARPHIFTHLIALVFAWQLRSFQRDQLTARQLCLRLVPLMAIWANLHGAFPTGFILIGTYAVANLTRRSKLMPLLALGGLCVAATFLTPYGWRLHEHILSFITTPYQAFFTNEWRSADFHSIGMRGFAFELLLLGILLVAIRPRLSLIDILLTGSWAFLGLSTVRNVPIFAYVVTPILAEHFNAFLQTVRWERFRKLSTDITALQQRTGGSLAVIAAIVAVIAVMCTGNPPSEPLPERFPSAAVEFVFRDDDPITRVIIQKTVEFPRRENTHGEMFNEYEWGGYLMQVLPERKVFIDGRNDFYGEAFLREYTIADKLQPGWDDVLKKYRVGWTLLRPTHPMNAVLALRTNEWHCAYRDGVAVIYTRDLR